MRRGRLVHDFIGEFDHGDFNGEDLDFYREEFREELVDEDEMTNEEAGFMQGYQEAS